MPQYRRGSNILLMLAGTFFGILACEIGLRMASISYPSFYQYDANVGISLRSEAEGWWKSEGEAYIKINSAGLRDREHTRAKPLSTLRIAVLGDSYAEAMQVPMEEAFWSILEREIKGCPALTGREPEIINFGVSGYGTAQELQTLRHRVWPYDPDIVLLAFTSGNDIRNNSRFLEQDETKPYFVFKNNQLVSDLTFRDSARFRFSQTRLAWWKNRILNASRIYQVFIEAVTIVRNARLAQQVHPPSFGVQGANATDKPDSVPGVTPSDGYKEAGLDATVYVEPYDPVWKEAWEVTERLIVLMQDDVKEKGADFIVVTLSTGLQVLPDPAVRRAFERRMGVPHLFYPDFRIRDLGERSGFAVLNLAPLSQAYAEEHKVFLHGFKNSGLGRGHWNTDGHRLAGAIIAQKLCGELLRKHPQARG